MIDTAVICAHFFARKAKWILICHHEKSKIIVPEIMVEAIICSNDQQPL